MYSLSKWGYPAPFIWAKSEFQDSSGTIKWMWKQGLIEEKFVERLWELNKTPVDPLTWAYYVYSKASGTDEYQILVGYEQLSGSYHMQAWAMDDAITNQQVEWNYNWYYIQAKSDDEVSLLWVPTIITGNISEDQLVTAWETIGVKVSWENKDVEFTLTELWDKMPTEDDEVKDFVVKLKESYLTGELDWVDNYDILDNLDPNGTPEQIEESINFWRIILWTSGSKEEVTVSPCYDAYGVKTLHWALWVDFWSRIWVSFEEIYSSGKDCDDYKKQFVCNNWTREEVWIPAETSTYKYTSCVNWLPQDCLATSVNYTDSIYWNFNTNYPDTTHNETTQNTITRDYNNWNYDFIFSSQCFNWSFINHNINRNKLNSCSENYHSENNMDCILNTKVCNTALWSGTQTRSNGSRGQCVLESCISGYHLEHWECLANEQDCTPNIVNASKAVQNWNFDSSFRWVCTAIECNWWYVIENNQCVDAIVFEDTFTLIGQSKVYAWYDKRITFEKDDVARDLLKIVNTNDNSEQIWMAQNMWANQSYTPVILSDHKDDHTTHKNSFNPTDSEPNNVWKMYQWWNNYWVYRWSSFNTHDWQVDCSWKTSSDFDTYFQFPRSTRDFCTTPNNDLWWNANTRAVCPQWYRLPTNAELAKMEEIVTWDSSSRLDFEWSKNIRKALKLPFFGNLYPDGTVYYDWIWLRGSDTADQNATNLWLDDYWYVYLYNNAKTVWITVRCIYSWEQN
jgi:hypothetical protein